MRIACPSCNAVYQVPDEQLSEGRLVRCVRCSTDWLPVVDVPAVDVPGDGGAEPVPDPVTGPVIGPVTGPVTDPVIEPVVEPARDAQPEVPVRRMALDEGMDAVAPSGGVAEVFPQAEAVDVPRARRVPWLAIAWVVSVLVVGAGVAALGVWREAVMAAWPPSVRAYAALGLAARP